MHPTRRGVLGMIGAGLAGAALAPLSLAVPAQSAGAVPPSGSVMQKLSAYMSEAAGRALPAAVVEKANQHILDTLAAMVSGSELGPGSAALEFSRAYGGKEVATVVAANFLPACAC